MVLRRVVGSLALAVATCARSARAQVPDTATVLRLLGNRAQDAFAPSGAPAMGGLVRLPTGVRAADLGLSEIAPGFGRVWGSPAVILAFADAHPSLRVEVSPPLHLLLDNAAAYIGATAANSSGHLGKNVLVGIADTGIDITHACFRDASGTRVQWLLDLSSKPIHKYPELEQKYGSSDASGNLVAGAVWAKSDIDALLDAGVTASLPQDVQGHGTLVASCAAGDDPRYRGVAPQAGLLIARVSGVASDAIGNDELLRGVAFLFDRADEMNEPVAVNLSVGSDYGPHDGSLDWEQALASHVGPTQPGHALIVAAGNSGSIADAPIHQSVHVSYGAVTRVPVVTATTQGEVTVAKGGVQIWIAMHSSANLSVGLDGPDGTWISRIGNDDSAGKNTTAFSAAIYNGSGATQSPVPGTSHGAVVIWQGSWPTGTYYVTLSGLGTAELWAQGTGDVSDPGDVGFAQGVREGTINLPATHPAIIGVGCTINKTYWSSQDGSKLGLPVPVLDAAGGLFVPNAYRDPTAGEPCWFSSAGPTVTGILKPEIMAPGAAIVGALSKMAVPGDPQSIFTPDCPADEPRCQQIDATHAVSFGTSFSAPLVAGAVALLFENDPTLTQDSVLAALQGGAHPLRSAAPFQDQAGAGELDVGGALAAVDLLNDPQTAIPSRSQSWLTLGADVYLADGSTPVEVLIELRAASQGAGPPVAADGFAGDRLVAYALIDGMGQGPVPVRRVGPGVWLASVQPRAGFGGSILTVGARFDGADVVDPKSISIAADVWNAEYPARVTGGCAVRPAARGALIASREAAFLAGGAVLWGAAKRRRRRRRRHRASAATASVPAPSPARRSPAAAATAHSPAAAATAHSPAAAATAQAAHRTGAAAATTSAGPKGTAATTSGSAATEEGSAAATAATAAACWAASE